MPVYWADQVETETKCPVCGGRLTVVKDSTGRAILPPVSAVRKQGSQNKAFKGKDRRWKHPKN